ncbi:hypothetical protein N0V82_001939 [Gnomoniopsis sp. IMI 355080]|nr:hypothetical protein N0V82_001939 [Gnomoniopsis sp. IMI 355080]
MAINSERATIPHEQRYLDSVAPKNLFYGTAWKGEQTAHLVYSAIKAGFRSIATAAQPKHYREDLVGEGVRRAIQENIVTRRDLYIQTTFTPFHSQDPNNCPYDPQLGIAEQVDVSIQLSRRHFAEPLTNNPGFLDAVVLHNLYPSADENVTVWDSLSTHIGQASVCTLGLSNVDKSDLESICALQTNKLKPYARPVVVQNRFHQGNDYDAAVRAVCKAERITYQTFGIRANSNMLNHQPSIVLVADKANVSREAALYGMLMHTLGCVKDGGVSLDVQIIVGTSNTARMAVLEQVAEVLMQLNDAYSWIAARSPQRQDPEVGHERCGESTSGSQPVGAYQLARRAFLIALGTED